jgi:hypothetical protein
VDVLKKKTDFCIFDNDYIPEVSFYDKGGCFSKYFLISFIFVCLGHALIWFPILYFYMIPCFNGQITYSEKFYGVVNNNVLQIKNTPCVFNNYTSSDNFFVFLFEYKNQNCLSSYKPQIQQNDCDLNNFKLTSDITYSDAPKYAGMIVIFIISIIALLWSTISFISMMICKIDYKTKCGCE